MLKLMSARMWIRDTAKTQITDWVTSHCALIVPKMGAKAKQHRARALQQAAEISSRNFSRFYTSGAHKSDDHRPYKQ